MWERLGHQPSIQKIAWPLFEAEKCEVSEVEVPIQVNGKKKVVMQINKNASEKEAFELAKEKEVIASFLAEGNLVKIIWVPGRILNLIIK